MNRPYVQIESENTIATLRHHLEKMLPEFEALPGVVGLTLNGGLSRGYTDHLSEKGSTGKRRVCLPFPVRGETGGGLLVIYSLVNVEDWDLFFTCDAGAVVVFGGDALFAADVGDFDADGTVRGLDGVCAAFEDVALNG